jgi:hypothetical protein
MSCDSAGNDCSVGAFAKGNLGNASASTTAVGSSEDDFLCATRPDGYLALSLSDIHE